MQFITHLLIIKGMFHHCLTRIKITINCYSMNIPTLGGSDVLKKLKDDRDAVTVQLEEGQNTRDEVLQRIGGVEARAERNESRMTSAPPDSLKSEKKRHPLIGLKPHLTCHPPAVPLARGTFRSLTCCLTAP